MTEPSSSRAPGAPLRRPIGWAWVTGLILTCAFLVGIQAEAWHDESDDHGECAVCHLDQESQALPRPPEAPRASSAIRLRLPGEVTKPLARSRPHRSARAPPAGATNPPS